MSDSHDSHDSMYRPRLSESLSDDCRTVGLLSDCRTVGLSELSDNCRTTVGHTVGTVIPGLRRGEVGEQEVVEEEDVDFLPQTFPFTYIHFSHTSNSHISADTK